MAKNFSLYLCVRLTTDVLCALLQKYHRIILCSLCEKEKKSTELRRTWLPVLWLHSHIRPHTKKNSTSIWLRLMPRQPYSEQHKNKIILCKCLKAKVNTKNGRIVGNNNNQKYDEDVAVVITLPHSSSVEKRAFSCIVRSRICTCYASTRMRELITTRRFLYMLMTHRL